MRESPTKVASRGFGNFMGARRKRQPNLLVEHFPRHLCDPSLRQRLHDKDPDAPPLSQTLIDDVLKPAQRMTAKSATNSWSLRKYRLSLGTFPFP